MTSFGLIPVLTTEAGSCVTVANWQEVGIKSASYHLTSLLMKPGYGLLQALPDLKSFTGWNGNLVLNASFSQAIAKNDTYALRSIYDGSRIQISIQEILALIAQLQPEVVILPQGVAPHLDAVWRLLPQSILPFFPVTDLPEEEGRPFGVYLPYDEAVMSPDSLFKQIDQYSHLPIYVAGNMGLALMIDLNNLDINYLESDFPALNAISGKVYRDEELISLTDSTFSNLFQPIDANCQCLTCQQEFTCAYLHHLFEQTPLLCRRFLIQHNLYYCQARMVD